MKRQYKPGRRRKYKKNHLRAFFKELSSFTETIFSMVQRAAITVFAFFIIFFVVAGSNGSINYSPKNAVTKLDAADHVLKFVGFAKNFVKAF